jgi:hypothetical protein
MGSGRWPVTSEGSLVEAHSQERLCHEKQGVS